MTIILSSQVLCQLSHTGPATSSFVLKLCGFNIIAVLPTMFCQYPAPRACILLEVACGPTWRVQLRLVVPPSCLMRQTLKAKRWQLVKLLLLEDDKDIYIEEYINPP
jgi:hypothetical protein